MAVQLQLKELAMACQHRVPVIVIVNNGYLSLIRQNQSLAYKYEYAVDLTYSHPDGTPGVDFVRLAEAFGAYGERVFKPEDLRPAFERAASSGRPAVIDIIVERETNATMGAALDAIREFA
jgi:tartronate-semialdehyde synthase